MILRVNMPKIDRNNLHYNLTSLLNRYKYKAFVNRNKPANQPKNIKGNDNYINIKMTARQLSLQAKQYDSQQFKMLYIYIKSLNLLNQLYLSEVMDRKQFDEEEKDILSRYQKIKQEIKHNMPNADLERFAELYNIEAEYKRVQSDPQTEQDKKIIQLAILLTSKITEIYDTLHQSKLVKDLINIVTEIDMLLSKLKINAKRVSSEFVKWMEKITDIKQSLKKKSIHEQLSSMEMYQLEDSITKIKILFQQFSAQ